MKVEGDLTSKVKVSEEFVNNGKDVFISRGPVEKEQFIKNDGNVFISKI